MSYDTIFKTFTGEPAASVHCLVCDVCFAVPQSLFDAWKARDRTYVHCPGCGTSLSPAGKSEAETLRDELTREKHRAEQARADADYQRNRKEHEQRRASAARGQVTKIKNRVKNGVCPVCNRTFGDLARHMHGQHPQFGEAEKA